MTKNEYIINQLHIKYPDLVKQEEISYILEETNKTNKQEFFKYFIKELNKS